MMRWKWSNTVIITSKNQPNRKISLDQIQNMVFLHLYNARISFVFKIFTTRPMGCFQHMNYNFDHLYCELKRFQLHFTSFLSKWTQSTKHNTTNTQPTGIISLNGLHCCTITISMRIWSSTHLRSPLFSVHFQTYPSKHFAQIALKNWKELTSCKITW